VGKVLGIEAAVVAACGLASVFASVWALDFDSDGAVVVDFAEAATERENSAAKKTESAVFM
jgi:hypothetical protein